MPELLGPNEGSLRLACSRAGCHVRFDLNQTGAALIARCSPQTAESPNFPAPLHCCYDPHKCCAAAARIPRRSPQTAQSANFAPAVRCCSIVTDLHGAPEIDPPAKHGETSATPQPSSRGLSHLRSASHLRPCAACNRGSSISPNPAASRRPGPSRSPRSARRVAELPRSPTFGLTVIPLDPLPARILELSFSSEMGAIHSDLAKRGRHVVQRRSSRIASTSCREAANPRTIPFSAICLEG